VLAVTIALLAALLQVTLAPLFPLRGALPDFALAAILVLVFAAGPVAAMVGLPFLALFLGFAADQSPGLVLISYLPLLPVFVLLEWSPVPLNRMARFGIAMLVTGLWARAIASAWAFLGGAEPGILTLAFDVLLPGVIFDAVLFLLVYIPFRLSGRTERSMALRQTGWEFA
jgi:hypothetical protein